MARFQYAGAASALALLAEIDDNDLAFTSSASAASYPDGSVGNFVVYLDREGAAPEKVRCTSRTGNTFTVHASGRGYDGTVAATHQAGVTIEHPLDSASLTDFARHVYATGDDDHSQYLTQARFETAFDDRYAEFIQTVPAASAYRSTGITKTHNNQAEILFDSEDYDDATNPMHSTVTATHRMTITTPGLYLVKGFVKWDSSASGDRYLWILKNGTTTIKENKVAGEAVDHYQEISDVIELEAADWVSLSAMQDSGGDLVLLGSSPAGFTRYPGLKVTFLSAIPTG
jgi:hypothetical protein